jgi:enoyl-CoA hydratase/carnithine racemase
VIEIERTHDNRVETWWLARPQARNAVNLEMWREIVELCERARGDRHVRVVVVRGRGPHFCAGADITGLGRALAADHDGTDYRATNAAAERAVATLPLPTIAAIDGFCIGGGVQLALSCDLRLATAQAQFAVTPAKIGIAYPASALQRLVSVVGVAATNELLLTGESIDATTALRIGMVNQVFENLDAGLEKLIDALLQRSPFTQAATKSVVAALVESVDVSTLGREWERESLNHGDLDEGLNAFREKRAPTFGERPL